MNKGPRYRPNLRGKAEPELAEAILKAFDLIYALGDQMEDGRMMVRMLPVKPSPPAKPSNALEASLDAPPLITATAQWRAGIGLLIKIARPSSSAETVSDYELGFFYPSSANGTTVARSFFSPDTGADIASYSTAAPTAIFGRAGTAGFFTGGSRRFQGHAHRRNMPAGAISGGIGVIVRAYNLTGGGTDPIESANPSSTAGFAQMAATATFSFSTGDDDQDFQAPANITITGVGSDVALDMGGRQQRFNVTMTIGWDGQSDTAIVELTRVDNGRIFHHKFDALADLGSAGNTLAVRFPKEWKRGVQINIRAKVKNGNKTGTSAYTNYGGNPYTVGGTGIGARAGPTAITLVENKKRSALISATWILDAAIRWGHIYKSGSRWGNPIALSQPDASGNQQSTTTSHEFPVRHAQDASIVVDFQLEDADGQLSAIPSAVPLTTGAPGASDDSAPTGVTVSSVTSTARGIPGTSGKGYDLSVTVAWTGTADHVEADVTLGSDVNVKLKKVTTSPATIHIRNLYRKGDVLSVVARARNGTAISADSLAVAHTVGGGAIAALPALDSLIRDEAKQRRDLFTANWSTNYLGQALADLRDLIIFRNGTQYDSVDLTVDDGAGGRTCTTTSRQFQVAHAQGASITVDVQLRNVNNEYSPVKSVGSAVPDPDSGVDTAVPGSLSAPSLYSRSNHIAADIPAPGVNWSSPKEFKVVLEAMEADGITHYRWIDLTSNTLNADVADLVPRLSIGLSQRVVLSITKAAITSLITAARKIRLYYYARNGFGTSLASPATAPVLASSLIDDPLTGDTAIPDTLSAPSLYSRSNHLAVSIPAPGGNWKVPLEFKVVLEAMEADGITHYRWIDLASNTLNIDATDAAVRLSVGLSQHAVLSITKAVLTSLITATRKIRSHFYARNSFGTSLASPDTPAILVSDLADDPLPDDPGVPSGLTTPVLDSHKHKLIVRNMHATINTTTSDQYLVVIECVEADGITHFRWLDLTTNSANIDADDTNVRFDVGLKHHVNFGITRKVLKSLFGLARKLRTRYYVVNRKGTSAASPWSSLITLSNVAVDGDQDDAPVDMSGVIISLKWEAHVGFVAQWTKPALTTSGATALAIKWYKLYFWNDTCDGGAVTHYMDPQTGGVASPDTAAGGTILHKQHRFILGVKKRNVASTFKSAVTPGAKISVTAVSLVDGVETDSLTVTSSIVAVGFDSVPIEALLISTQQLIKNGDFTFGKAAAINTCKRWLLGIAGGVISTTSLGIVWDRANGWITWTDNTTYPTQDDLLMKYRPGDWFSVSFEAKSTTARTITISAGLAKSTDVNGGNTDASASVSCALTTSLQLFAVTFQISPGDISNAARAFQMWTAALLSSINDVIITRIMMVRGKQPVAFSPRPDSYEVGATDERFDLTSNSSLGQGGLDTGRPSPGLGYIAGGDGSGGITITLA